MRVNWGKIGLAGQAVVEGIFCPLTLAGQALTMRRETDEIEKRQDADSMAIAVMYFLTFILAAASVVTLVLLILVALAFLL